jgi:hypothetical protein
VSAEALRRSVVAVFEKRDKVMVDDDRVACEWGREQQPLDDRESAEAYAHCAYYGTHSGGS